MAPQLTQTTVILFLKDLLKQPDFQSHPEDHEGKNFLHSLKCCCKGKLDKSYHTKGFYLLFQYLLFINLIYIAQLYDTR